MWHIKCRIQNIAIASLLLLFLDHSGYLVPVEERAPTAAAVAVTTTEAPSIEDSPIYSEAQSPPPQDKPKDKVYDYAKPEDIICLTASRSSLDNLDLHTDTDSGYVGNKNYDNDDNGPSSPFYATVEGPSSPGVTSMRGPSEGSPDGTPVENELDDCKPDYVEVLPDSGSERENALINANSTA